MVSQIIGAADQPFLVEPSARQAGNAISGEYGRKDFKLFGDDGFTFRDFIDMINPLHHIPVIGTIYRAVTGDQIDPGAKMFGSTLLGGPIGAIASIIDVAVKHNTGKDMGEHVVAMFTGKGDAPEDPGVTATDVASNDTGIAASPSQPAIANGFKAAAPDPLAGTGRDFTAAGMTGIPRVSPETLAGFMGRATDYAAAAAPDLQALANFDTAAGPGQPARGETVPVNNKPLALNPHYAIDENLSPQAGPQAGPEVGSVAAPAAVTETAPKIAPGPAPRQAPAQRQLAQVKQALADSKNGWLTQTMMQAMDKYESGRRLGVLPSVPGHSVLR